MASVTDDQRRFWRWRRVGWTNAESLTRADITRSEYLILPQECQSVKCFSKCWTAKSEWGGPFALHMRVPATMANLSTSEKNTVCSLLSLVFFLLSSSFFLLSSAYGLGRPNPFPWNAEERDRSAKGMRVERPSGRGSVEPSTPPHLRDHGSGLCSVVVDHVVDHGVLFLCKGGGVHVERPEKQPPIVTTH